ncbi:AAA family ATPase [Planosporangium sp. 12N6]|uniref:AAA family ATPase n=1 Tax=Planosporangium spinosum TaxID=3402278 RepID=UPI003CEF35A7
MVNTRPSTPIGRGEILEQARVRLAAGGSILLYGPAGIGKSTILQALAADADPALVLRANAAEAEAELPYLALVDLFDGVLDEYAAELPEHLRAALDGALLRSALPDTAHDQLAVRLAVLELVRALAADRPVLLVLDDVQWIDQPSAGVLRFVTRRLDTLPVRILAAERAADGGAPVSLDLCPPGCLELAVPPLPEPDVADLLRARLGVPVPRSRLHRVYSASGGNPLFAVELGRALRERDEDSPTAPLPVPDRLRALLAARIATLPGYARPALLVAAATARPTRSLLEHCGVDIDRELGEVACAGVISIDGDAVAFTHPLLREMVYADASPAERRRAHELLAEAVSDRVERARHLAQARPEPDESLAATLAEAATVARLRGAPATAADLAALAAERTLASMAGVAAARRLLAATHAFDAGSPADATRYATAALREGAEPGTRVGARLLLFDLAGQDKSGVAPLLDAAFKDAADDLGLLARVRLYRAVKAHYDRDTEAALAELKRAEETAEQAGDFDCLVEVLGWRGSFVDGPESDEILERAGELALDLPLSRPVVAARQLAAMSRLVRGDTAEAIRRIESLREAVERSGMLRDLAVVLISVTGIYWRAGRCADSLAAGRDCARLYADVETTPGPGLLVGAQGELFGGTADQAAVYAEQAVRAIQDAGDEDWLKIAYATQGMVHVLRGDPVAAAEVMRQAWAIEQRLGRIDPALWPWHADFVESLIASGARAEAAEVLAEVRRCADLLDRRVAMLGLARAGAVLAAGADPREAAETLSTAIATWVDHPYPIEVARAWHTLGGLERRAHRRGAARAAFAEAVRRYTAADAAPWARVASAELARLDGGRGAGLSETERRIVELVRGGATNREIARSMFLSIKAVEANLTRLYRRLGVRNRAQLARALDSTD